MPSYLPPKCYQCKKLKTIPRNVGDKASCSAYKKIPDGIFYKSGDCKYFESKFSQKKKKKRKR